MNYAIVLAGGVGVRMGNPKTPKQFISLCGKPIVIYSLQGAAENENIDKICIVCATEWQEQVKEWCDIYGITKPIVFAEAGSDRQKSVHSGIKKLDAKDDDIVMIMTAVCPFVSQKTIDRSFKLLEKYEACITVVRASDAITFSNDGYVANNTLQKSKMFIQQGPQTFRYGLLKKGHEMYEADENRNEVNEDSELVLNMGTEVAMVLGDRFCIKVTYPEDIAIAEAIKPLFEKSQMEG